MPPARSSASSTSTRSRPSRSSELLEPDIDAAIRAPARLVGALRFECAACGLGELRRVHAELFEEARDRARAPRAEPEVVLLGPARIGAPDELELLARERAGGDARRDLL